MNRPTFLLDTNIILPLEDNKPLDKPLSEFIQLCGEHHINILIHEGSLEDINNDKDQERKAITLSKVNKFTICKGVVAPGRKELEKLYGHIDKSNDYIDCRLLHAVDQVGIADFLLTQDQGLHKRAKNNDIADKIFTIDDALDWIKRTYTPKQVVLPKVKEKYCHEIDRNDPIFNTLRDDYAGFDEWFKSCCKKRRKCWVIEEEGKLVGIIIWKHEPVEEIGDLKSFNPKKVFKICTFKVSPAFRGERFGEQLLKQVLWYAYKNGFDLCYLTVFAKKHVFLTRLIELYGFSKAYDVEGEDYYIKRFLPVDPAQTLSPISYLNNYYPSFRDDSQVSKFIIPIRPEFHEILFPEKRQVYQESLFNSDGTITSGESETYVPGNSIRKVYLTRAPCKRICPGDIIIFYMSKGDNYTYAQSVTTLCVVEDVKRVTNLDELIKITAKRSVYTIDQLEAHINHCLNNNKSLTVINFFVCGHFLNPVRLSTLKEVGVINGHPPQQPQQIHEPNYRYLTDLMELVF
ncbi:MAG: GNAT family N-acetyltransferase [Pseudomonadales bacterium]|nr:GNAT family N-acetyltransferase [Pseudomonadales bacterium]